MSSQTSAAVEGIMEQNPPGPESDLAASTRETSAVDALSPESERAVALLRGVSLDAEVVLGRRTLSVGEFLGLDAGVLLELDAYAGSEASLAVNGRTVAAGEVVVVDGRFALRVTRILAETDEREASAAGLRTAPVG